MIASAISLSSSLILVVSPGLRLENLVKSGARSTHQLRLSKRTYNHVAFQIRDEDLDEIALRIKSLGLEVREARNRIEGEGQSLYFYDFDNHLFELHTGTLDQRLQSYSQGNKNDAQKVETIVAVDS